MPIIFALSIFLYIISLVFTIFDINHASRYLIFSLHIASVVNIAIYYVKHNINKKILHKAFYEKELMLFAIALILVEFVSINHIFDYPFVNAGDGVRDAGLDALKIANGTITNFFRYGNYNGYGEIIPIIASFFYSLFGSSVLTYRIPGAIIATVDVALLYLLLRLITNRTTAAIGAGVLALFPLHMYYARTELVVIFDSFWTTLLLLTFYLWVRKKRAIDYVMLGTVIGMAANFHTAVRIVAIILALIVIVMEIKKRFKHLLLFTAFCLVGFGPLILASSPDNFLQKTRYAPSSIQTLGENYKKSLVVWFYEGTTSRYPLHKPILSVPLFIVFVIGICYSFFLKPRLFFATLFIFVFVLPFTNSAMTDWINADHRLIPLLPIAAIFIALGLKWITENTQSKLIKIIVFTTFISFLLFQTYQFFTKFPANNDKGIKDYLSMHIINLLKSQNDTTGNLCIVVSPENYKNLDFLHYKEQYQYFLPNANITIKKNAKINDSEAYVFRKSCPEDYKQASNIHTTLCSSKRTNYCPVDFIGEINIYTD
jgi:4-amino-4-deoxy-L-arabinose transferase-like glycosyltransferase